MDVVNYSTTNQCNFKFSAMCNRLDGIHFVNFDFGSFIKAYETIQKDTGCDIFHTLKKPRVVADMCPPHI